MAQRTDTATITPIEPTDETALHAWFDLAAAAQSHDRPGDPPPTRGEVHSRLTAPHPGMSAAGWLARVDGEVAGAAVIDLPQRDNPEAGWADIVVAPGLRRRGVGSALLAEIGAAARADGRRRLIFGAIEPFDGPSAGSLFLTAAGARLGLRQQRHRLDLLALDHASLARHAAAARAAATDYDLVQWTGVTPDRWLDDIAALAGAMSTDAPQDDLSLAPEIWDADRVRASDTARHARGLVRTVTAAVAPDGHLAAFTFIIMSGEVDWHADQAATLVLREHRGHRLGMLVKLANLEAIRSRFPAVRAIDTFTADSNPHMGSINEAIGFRPYDRSGEWELDL